MFRTPPERGSSSPVSRVVALHLGLMAAAALAGCAGGGTSGGTTAASSATPPAQGSTSPSEPDEPMTLFEKRRLIARVQQDPRTIQRLTPRERRELAAMVKAVKKDEERHD